MAWVGDPSTGHWEDDTASRRRAPAYDPTSPPGTNWNTNGFTPTTDPNENPNGSRSGPGYGEQFWQQNQGKWYQPTASDQYWNGVQGKFAAGPQSSHGVSNAYDEYFRPNADQSYSERGADQGPRGTDHSADAYGRFQGEGSSYGERFQDSGGPHFSNYGADAFRRGAAGTGPDYTGRYAPGAMAAMGNATGLEREAAGGAGSQRVNSQDVFSQFFQPLSQASESEGVARDPGLKAYYDRAAETGQEQIDKASAARGLFSSGSALDESRELAKDLGADRAKNEADYRLRVAGQADQQRLARMGLAGTLGSSADAANVAGSANRRSWLESADKSMLARDEAQRSWAGQGDTLGIQRSANAHDWASLLDTNELGQRGEERMSRTAADTARQARNTLGLDFTRTMDANSLAKSADERAWAGQGDTSRIARSADQRSWAETLDRGNRDDQRLGLDYLTAGGDLAGRRDRTNLDYLESAARGAATADTSQRNRLQDQFENYFKLAGAQSGATQQSGDAGIQDWLKLLTGGIDANLGRATNSYNEYEQGRNRRDAAGSQGAQMYAMA